MKKSILTTLLTCVILLTANIIPIVSAEEKYDLNIPNNKIIKEYDYSINTICEKEFLTLSVNVTIKNYSDLVKLIYQFNDKNEKYIFQPFVMFKLNENVLIEENGHIEILSKYEDFMSHDDDYEEFKDYVRDCIKNNIPIIVANLGYDNDVDYISFNVTMKKSILQNFKDFISNLLN